MRSLAASGPSLPCWPCWRAFSMASAFPSMWFSQLSQDPVLLLERIMSTAPGQGLFTVLKSTAHNSKVVPFLQLAGLPLLGYSVRGDCLTALSGLCVSLWEADLLYWNSGLIVWPGVLWSPSCSLLALRWHSLLWCVLLCAFYWHSFLSKKLASGFLLAGVFLQAPGLYWAILLIWSGVSVPFCFSTLFCIAHNSRNLQDYLPRALFSISSLHL